MRMQTGQRGFSLVEILVVLVISLILLAGVWNVFLASRQSYRTNEALSLVQDNGRYAAGLLARELRLTGYKGSCGPNTTINNLLDPGGAGYEPALFDLDNALQGWDNALPVETFTQGVSGYVAGTDVLLSKHAGLLTSLTASGNTATNAVDINLTNSSGIPTGAIVVVSDHQGCDIFQNGADASASKLNRGAGGTPGNINPDTSFFSHEYEGDMEIYTVRSALYYIGADTDGRPALRRRLFDQGSASDELLADGVEDMQITYGEDLNGDRRVDRYCPADAIASWRDVLAARVTLRVASRTADILDVDQALTYDDGAADPDPAGCEATEVTSSDRRLRQVFTTTIALRNRLP
ncbi:MAG: PilW family protein [Gammaproteobacteria bacterium]|nr:PilW family protein [Gammaproteobacteria bacterium]